MQKTAAVYAVEGDEGEQLAEAPPQSEIHGVSAEIAEYAEPEMQETFTRWMLTCVNLVASVHLNGRIEESRGMVREVIALQAKFTRQVNAALSREIAFSGRDRDRKKGRG